MTNFILRFVVAPMVIVLSAVLSSTALADDKAHYFNHLLIFGDSLMDSGNIVHPLLGTLTFTDPLAGVPTVPGYQAGKVTPNFFAEQLGLTSIPATQGGSNYATAGFTTPTITAAIAFYLQNTPRINERTLVWLNGGGNDFLTPGIAPAEVLAGASRLATAAQILSNSGARYVMVSNLPNFAYTPYIYQTCLSPGLTDEKCDANVRAPTGELVNGFNQLLAAQLKASDGNFIIADVNTLFTKVRQNPQQYGFTARTGSYDYLFQNCYNYDPSKAGFSDGCPEDPDYGRNAPNADASKLIFADDVHPTQAFHRLVADYHVDIIYAPTEVALLPEIGLYGVRRQLDSRAQTTEQMMSDDDHVVNPCFIGMDFDSINLANNGPAAQGDINGWGLHLGCSKRLSAETKAMAQINLGKSKLQAHGRASSYDATSIGFAGFVNFRRDPLFAHGGVAIYGSDIAAKRVHTIGGGRFTAAGNTSGQAVGTDFGVGYDWVHNDRWQLAPVVGYSYVNSKVDGYQENSNSVSKYHWRNLQTSSRQIRGGLVGTYSPTSWRLQWRAFMVKERDNNFREVYSGSHYLPGFQRDDEVFSQFIIGLDKPTEAGKLQVNWNFSTQGGNNHLFGVSYQHHF